MNVILSLALILLFGLLINFLLKRFKLPSVTSYLIAGVIFGPYCLGLIGIEGIGLTSLKEVENLGFISSIALGFIAFSIGDEFKLSNLKNIGKQAVIIGIVQALAAALLIDVALILVATFFPNVLTISQAITLGAIGTATAPAATLMVVKQYHCKGKMVDLLLPIVALDDAVGLVVFSISFGIAKALALGQFSMISILLNPLLEIILSLLLGAILGFIGCKLDSLFTNNSTKLTIALAMVLAGVGISSMSYSFNEVEIGFSSLLVCMMIGSMYTNMDKKSEDLMKAVDVWTTPLLVLFFVISGSNLQLSILKDIPVLLIGLVYIITRSLGKYLGAYVSSKATGCEKKIYDNLGICLLPQAGVALGMCITAMQLGQQGVLIKNITLLAVLIYELVGPLLAKLALKKSCEEMD